MDSVIHINVCPTSTSMTIKDIENNYQFSTISFGENAQQHYNNLIQELNVLEQQFETNIRIIWSLLSIIDKFKTKDCRDVFGTSFHCIDDNLGLYVTFDVDENTNKYIVRIVPVIDRIIVNQYAMIDTKIEGDTFNNALDTFADALRDDRDRHFLVQHNIQRLIKEFPSIDLTQSNTIIKGSNR